MLKSLRSFCAAVIAVFTVATIATTQTGCKSVPTTDGMYRTSYAVGVATGMVLNNTTLDDATRNAIISTLNVVEYCTPETNQTFEVAWMDKARQHLASLVAEGKINADQAAIAETAFQTVCRGIDYLFKYRFPSALQYKEVVSAGIYGFTDGFLVVFKPANPDALTAAPVAFDVEAYKYLRANADKSGNTVVAK